MPGPGAGVHGLLVSARATLRRAEAAATTELDGEALEGLDGQLADALYAVELALFIVTGAR